MQHSGGPSLRFTVTGERARKAAHFFAAPERENLQNLTVVTGILALVAFAMGLALPGGSLGLGLFVAAGCAALLLPFVALAGWRLRQFSRMGPLKVELTPYSLWFNGRRAALLADRVGGAVFVEARISPNDPEAIEVTCETRAKRVGRYRQSYSMPLPDDVRSPAQVKEFLARVEQVRTAGRRAP